MKKQNSIVKLFKGCRVLSADFIDEVIYVFRLVSKTGAMMRYTFNVEEIDESRLWGSELERVKKEREQSDEMLNALKSMIDKNTYLYPRYR